MRLRKFQKIFSFVLIISILSACTPFSELAKSQQRTAMMRESVVPPGTVLQVNKGDGSRFTFTVDDINDLPTYEFQVNSEKIQGKQILKILEVANVGDYQYITFNSHNDSVTLDKKQVRDNLVLIDNTQFSMQLYSDTILEEQCIKNVSSISIE